MGIPVLDKTQLTDLCKRIFIAAGALSEEAEIVSNLLVKSNLVGHASHGVIRVPQYFKAIRKGLIQPRTEIKIFKETRSSALLDGQWGFGQIIAKKAMEIAIAKAKTNVVGTVCAFNLHHIGRLADYTTLASKKDMIGIAMVDSVKAVTPFGGRERLLSTSPISYAFPTSGESPFVLDIATSVCAEGKVRVRFHEGKKMPDGCIIDKDGKPTNEPADFYGGGALLPLGGDLAGYKGFGLAFTVEVLSGILSGAGLSFKEGKRDNGVFLQAINIEAFTSINSFKNQISKFIQTIKNSKTRPGFQEILIPGEPEFRTEKRLLNKGIFLPDTTWNELKKIAGILNVNIPNI